MAKANPTIGRCPCPVEGCDLLMDVKRIQARTDAPKRQRKAGLLYGDCPEHGRFGFDGAPAMQTYIEDNSTKCDESDKAGSAPAAPSERPKPAPPALEPKAPAPTPEPPKPAPTSAPPTPTSARTRLDLLDW